LAAQAKIDFRGVIIAQAFRRLAEIKVGEVVAVADSQNFEDNGFPRLRFVDSLDTVPLKSPRERATQLTIQPRGAVGKIIGKFDAIWTRRDATPRYT
jgi:hypothetical protein